MMTPPPNNRSSISAGGSREDKLKNRFRELSSAALPGSRPVSKQSARASTPATDVSAGTRGGDNKHKPKHRKKKKTDEEEAEEREPDSPPPPVPAWSMFTDHVKIVSRSDLSLGEKKETYDGMCSEDHHKTLTEIKEINMKKQAKTMMMKIAALDRIKLSRPIAVLEDDKPESEPEGEVSESEEESEDEAEIADRQRRKATARQHWKRIRGYVQDRITQRKKKGGFNQDKAFKRLRAQAKASMNPEQARRELYEKYGIVPKAGRMYPEDVMKPVHSTKATEIIQKFEQIKIISIHAKNRPRTSYLQSGGENEKIEVKSRPRTMNHHGVNYHNRRFR